MQRKAANKAYHDGERGTTSVSSGIFAFVHHFWADMIESVNILRLEHDVIVSIQYTLIAHRKKFVFVIAR